MSLIASFMLFVTIGSTVIFNGVFPTASEKLVNRSLLGLFHILRCTSDCSALGYLNYGCYCGYGGYGDPMNDIDRCCQQHDQCYSAANDVCYTFQWYITAYNFECHDREPYCKVNDIGSCSAKICMCDSQLVKCLRKYPCPSSNPHCDIPLSKRIFNGTVNSLFKHRNSRTRH